MFQEKKVDIGLLTETEKDLKETKIWANLR